MMESIDCTLLSDGSSDRMLVPLIRWLLNLRLPNTAVNFNYADLRPILTGSETLSDKICHAIDLFPCDVLFIHRDAEKESYDKREEEINNAVNNTNCGVKRIIPVIPIKMSEAWLLINIEAIRLASGNSNGKVRLSLPAIEKLESLPDPKNDLIALLNQATELNKRRLRSFNPYAAIHRVAESITDYSTLRRLQSFRRLEEKINEL